MKNGLTKQDAVSSIHSVGEIGLVAAISATYLLSAYWLIGFRPEQLFLVLFFNSLYFLSAPTRKFILGFSVFIIYWIIFDFMKAFPNYAYNTVHIADIYEAEKKIFGIHSGNSVLTPNEYWVQHASPFLNVLTGCFYLCWIPFPLLFAAFLFYRNRREFYLFAFTFMLVNLLGFIVYYAFPAAPPWYVAEHGFFFQANTPGSTAGLARFDAYFHSGIFKSIYSKSSNVFAAMPSLHSAYPLVVLYYAIRNKMVLLSYFATIVAEGIWFSAVYNSHHYVLDILAGIVCAVTGMLLMGQLEKRSVGFNNAIGKLAGEDPATEPA